MRKLWGRGESGQGAVELALTLPIIFTVIMGVVELGVAFNAYVTVASAAREGARAGALYLYDSGYSQALNDQNRESGTGTGTPYTDNVRDTVAGNLGNLRNYAPFFDKNTDVTISYTPAVSTLDTRRGDLITVRVTYRHQLLSKVVSGQPTLTFTAQATARIE